MAYLLCHPTSPVTYAVPYADLIAEPDATVRALLNTLGVTFHPTMRNAFTQVHAASRPLDVSLPSAFSREHEWHTLDPTQANSVYLHYLDKLYTRFGRHLYLPSAFAKALEQVDTGKGGVIPSNPYVLQSSAGVPKDQVIDRLHETYAHKLQQREQEIFELWNKQQRWIAELEQARIWLDEHSRTQQEWIAELEQARIWLDGQRQQWQQLAEMRGHHLHIQRIALCVAFLLGLVCFIWNYMLS